MINMFKRVFLAEGLEPKKNNSENQLNKHGLKYILVTTIKTSTWALRIILSL